MVARLALLVCASILLAANAYAQELRWYEIVTDDGARLGYASTEISVRDGRREVVDEQRYYLREHNAPATRISSRTVRTEGADGAVSEIVETTRTGDFTSHTRVRLSQGGAEIVRETPSGERRDVVQLPADVRFDQGEALLAAWDSASAPQLEFYSFSIDALGAERVVLTNAVRDASGRMSAMRLRYDGDELRGIGRIVIGADGRIVEAAQPLFGRTIHFRLTDQGTATQTHAPYAVVSNAMTRSPFRIGASARRGHIRYSMTFRDGFTFALPQTGEQRQAQQGAALILDVCDACGPGLATDAETLAHALRPTAWLQSDHPRLLAIAAPIARLDVSDARKMELLLERAQPYLARIDYNGHYSALDTIVRRAGDCTEAAVLLAALGRAAGIPTRVASGLTYSRESYHGVSNAFMPHSWTLAYVDGRWRSFDLALNEFDSTHIALTIGDGDPRSVAAAGQLASLLVLDSLAEVRPRS